MIFVNDLASVRDIPWWLRHMPQTADGMTFVDVVFPAFLFIVGMSIPYAIERRFRECSSILHVSRHIVIRTFGLLALGVLMVNIHVLNEPATGLSREWWSLLMFIAAILVWNRISNVSGGRVRLAWIVRATGLLTLVVLAILYRGGDAPNVHWLQTSWWGILGLIGWSYLVSSIAYLCFRNSLPGIVGALALFVLMYGTDKAGAFHAFTFITDNLWLGGHIGAHASVTTAGIVLAMIVRESRGSSFRSVAIPTLVFTVMLAGAGWLLQPVYGINKVAATPSWCLYCAAICSLLFLGLHWLTDFGGRSSWFKFAAPAGSNPLLAYILPDIFYAIAGVLAIPYFAPVIGTGALGIIRSLVFSLAILGITNLLTRRGIQLRL